VSERYYIDIGKDIFSEKTDQDRFMVNTGRGKAISRGPTCIFTPAKRLFQVETYKGKKEIL
jgi:hypothetical protein